MSRACQAPVRLGRMGRPCICRIFAHFPIIVFTEHISTLNIGYREYSPIMKKNLHLCIAGKWVMEVWYGGIDKTMSTYYRVQIRPHCEAGMVWIAYLNDCGLYSIMYPCLTARAHLTVKEHDIVIIDNWNVIGNANLDEGGAMINTWIWITYEKERGCSLFCLCKTFPNNRWAPDAEL